MKIGALAKAVGVTVPTIRFWTAEKLLEVADVTASGYQLYSPEMIARCELIRSLKEQRLTLAEIKRRLG
jgi:DNA-binding transcriptional MerR regulator